MSGVVVTGSSVLTPLGDSPEDLHTALCRGRSGLCEIKLFDTAGLTFRRGGEIASFDAGRYLGNANLRPLDRATRLTASAVRLALEICGVDGEDLDPEEIGLVLGTMFSGVSTISAFDRRAQEAGPAYASPLDFANAVINAPAGQAAILHQLRGVNSTISTGTTSALRAFAYGANLVAQGRQRVVLAGGVEALCFPSLHGFHKSGQICGVSPNGTARPAEPCSVPFSHRRNGFALGEGAAMLVLEDGEAARRRGATALAEIRGFGEAFDPSLGAEEERSVSAISSAARRALESSGFGHDEVDCVSCSANGSRRHDRHEALGLAEVFEQRKVPVTAIKSMLGESLGASAAIQAADLIETFRASELPGVLGLDQLDAELAFVDATGTARNGGYRSGLISSVGFDGHCSAMVMIAADHAGGTAGAGS